MRGVIFDCDGVLVDSEKLSCGAWLPVLARHGMHVELAEIEQFIGKSDRAVLEHVNRAHHARLDQAIIDEREAEYVSSARGRLGAFAGLKEALLSLREAGLALAVASSGRPTKIRFALEEVGIAGLFSVVCSAVEVPHGKPAPDLFLLAAGRLGIEPSECAVVEDAVYGIQAARAAGMRAIGFTSSTSELGLRQAGAEQTFGDYRELGRILGVE
jgi:HAD superfamily hydrolase (TIGR01509 family)